MATATRKKKTAKQALNRRAQKKKAGRNLMILTNCDTSRPIDPNKITLVIRNENGDTPSGFDIPKLAKILGIEANPASDPVAYVDQLKAKLNEILTQMGGGEPSMPPPDAGAEEEGDEEEMDAMMDEEEDDETMNAEDDEEETDNAEEDDEEDIDNSDEYSSREDETSSNTRNSSKKAIQRWFKNAPPEVREAFKTAQSITNQQKQGLIKKILVNVSSTDERKRKAKKLLTNSVSELKDLLTLIGQPQKHREEQYTDYSGLGFIDNSSQDDDDSDEVSAMEPPVMNWSRKKEKIA